jgi:catechol 2,3-dioxygenase
MSTIDPSLRIASVTLAVSDLDRSVDFYVRVLGLELMGSENHHALLGTEDEHPALLLTSLDEPTIAPANSTGLFHVAWLHRTRAGLAQSLRRVAANNWPLEGASDHGVSEALYLSDPDGLGIELYADRPRESWEPGPEGHGVRMFTIGLDLEDLLAQARGASARIESATRIGHVHLKVSDVPAAVAFYREGLGFEEQARIPSAGFLSAGGYHHHIGLNSWQSQGGSPAPGDAPGLRLIDFQLTGPKALSELRGQLHSHAQSAITGEVEDRLVLTDPDGTRLSFSGATSER